MSTTERKRSRAGGAGKRGASPMPMRTTAEIEADSVSRTVRELNRRRALIEENVRARMARGETFPARAPSFDLAEHLRDFVRDAVQSGEVLYDPATGLAYVKEASHPPFPDVGEPGWGTAEWDAEAERRRLIRERESNLKFALGDPRLQAHALLWLDAPAVETGMLSRWGADDMARDFGIIAFGVEGAPPPVVRRVRDIQPKLRAPNFNGPTREEVRAEVWEAALVIAVVNGATHWHEHADSFACVHYVIRQFEAGVGELAPENVLARFRAPKTGAVGAAAKLMESLRLDHIKREYWPPKARIGAGRSKSAWGAARDFARAFGVKFVEKPSQLGRRKN